MNAVGVDFGLLDVRQLEVCAVLASKRELRIADVLRVAEAVAVAQELQVD